MRRSASPGAGAITDHGIATTHHYVPHIAAVVLSVGASRCCSSSWCVIGRQLYPAAEPPDLAGAARRHDVIFVRSATIEYRCRDTDF